MDPRQIRLEGGPLNGRAFDPTEDRSMRLVLVNPEDPDKPVAVYVMAVDGDAGEHRRFAFLEWDKRRSKKKTATVAP